VVTGGFESAFIRVVRFVKRLSISLTRRLRTYMVKVCMNVSPRIRYVHSTSPVPKVREKHDRYHSSCRRERAARFQLFALLGIVDFFQ
jgi:hypothetical protein